MLCFRDLHTLFTVFIDTLYEIFLGRLRAQVIYFYDTIVYCFYYERLSARVAVCFENAFKCLFPLQSNV